MFVCSSKPRRAREGNGDNGADRVEHRETTAEFAGSMRSRDGLKARPYKTCGCTVR